MDLATPLPEALATTKKHLKALKEMGLLTIRDLLLYFPRAHEDLSHFIRIAAVKDGQVVTVKGFLQGVKTERTRSRRALTRAALVDEMGVGLDCVWFNQPHLQRMLPIDTPVIASGKVQFAYGKFTLQNPEIETKKEAQLHTGGLVPTYPQHDVITSKWLRNKIHPLLYLTKQLPECLPPIILDREGLMEAASAVREIHFPKNKAALKQAKDRLAYEELFILQLHAVKAKREWRESGLAQKTERSIPMDVDLVKRFFASLPFTPTGAQKITIYEILKDMEQPFPMMRLLEGDVGSGKTVVALAAMVTAVSAGFQAALMAPTEVLARQHYQTVRKLLGADTPHALLLGSLKAAEKKAITERLKTGDLRILVGTHALIQQSVSFCNLGLAVIDEQHRFGVKQRDLLLRQGGPHVLNMTATPIPRTLAMVAYGDQDLSVLNEMPPGRQTIITKVVPPEHRVTVNRFAADRLRQGQQMYVICPLIDESDTLEVTSVKREFERLRTEVFPEFRAGMLHGRMKAAAKEAVMAEFSSGAIDILVSTSVIEVGVDVPNATLIMIEGADRFGLAQLHQFRGRVGRGTEQSYCFLFTESHSGNTYTRLKAMTDHSNGFELAEIDLKLRGPGEVYGVRQSGLPDLKIATLSDGVLVARVRRAAEELIEHDPTLEKHPLLQQAVDRLWQRMDHE